MTCNFFSVLSRQCASVAIWIDEGAASTSTNTSVNYHLICVSFSFCVYVWRVARSIRNETKRDSKSCNAQLKWWFSLIVGIMSTCTDRVTGHSTHHIRMKWSARMFTEQKCNEGRNYQVYSMPLDVDTKTNERAKVENGLKFSLSNSKCNLPDEFTRARPRG